MIGIRNLFKKTSGPSLADRLKTYPAFSDIHVAAPEDLSDAQAKDNLENFIARRDERLGILSDLLSAFDIDLEAGLAVADPNPFLDQIDAWAAQHWRAVPATRDQLRRAYWKHSDRAGADIVYSMLRDVALLLGEIVIRRLDGTYWGLDDRLRKPDDGAGFRRPVVLGLTDPSTGRPDTIETDQHCFTAFAYIAKAADPNMHRFTQYCRVTIEKYAQPSEAADKS